MADQLRVHLANVRKRYNAVFVATTEIVQESVVAGSPITGAAGQPVDEFELLPSWIPEFVSDTEWKIETNKAYARAIEDGVGPYGPLTLRSEVGGFHSVRDTLLGWPKIKAEALRRVGNA